MSFKIRKAKFSDARFWLDLRNQADVRKVSFSTSKIAWNEHRKWFWEKINSESKDFYVLIWKNRRVGQVRIDHEDTKKSIISIALLNMYRGQGLGVKAVKAATKDFLKKYPKRTLIANIKPENLRSAQCFENAGYRYKGKAVVQKQSCRRYVAAGKI